MDMVLCNFLKGSEEVLGVPFPKADKREKWIKISSTKDFWANLEWMPDCPEDVDIYQQI